MEQVQKSIKLRSFRQNDASTLVTLCNNKKIWDNVRDYFPHPYTKQDAMDFIKSATAKRPQEIFAIEYENQLVGCIGVHPQTDVYRLSAEIGYWIGEPFWGMGIATRAIRLVVTYAFNTLGVLKIYAGCFDFNLASQKVLLKAGFQEEATLKKAVFKNEVLCNEIRYAIFKPE